jgi:Transposase DDE domain
MVVSRTTNGRKVADQPARVINADLLHRALSWAICDKILDGVQRHGNTRWKAGSLVILAVLWVWSDDTTLTGAFAQARTVSLRMLGAVAVTTFQGLTSALVVWTTRLRPLLWCLLQERMKRCAGDHWRVGIWLALAMDGSRVATPRTRSNEQAFSTRHYGRGGKARTRRNWKNKKRRTRALGQPMRPQMWLTLLWHMGMKMPWAWQTGPSTSSERHHMRDLIDRLKFPENTLFCGDAGFVGYDMWDAIRAAGHHFVVRVGANVRLLRHLGRIRTQDGIVWFWPAKILHQHQPPLTLRLLKFQGDRGPIYLATSVLSDDQLPNEQVLELYRQRWGVELQFRAFKQTFGRGNLRSRAAQNATVELEWSLFGLWIIQLFAVKEQIRVASPPSQSSVALAVRVIHDLIRDWRQPAQSDAELRERLRDAIKDTYQRTCSKKARYRPPYKDQPSHRPPLITNATRQQRQAFQRLNYSDCHISLTA